MPIFVPHNERREYGQVSEGETLHGWGVVRSAPWHFVGLYADKATAEAAAKEAGPDYIVRLGDNQAGTDNFLWTNGDNPGATD